MQRERDRSRKQTDAWERRRGWNLNFRWILLSLLNDQA